MNAEETINEVTKQNEAEESKAVFQMFSLTKDDFLKHAPMGIKDRFLAMTDEEQMRFLSLFIDEMQEAFVNEFLPYWKKVMNEVFGMDKDAMNDLFGQALKKPKAEPKADEPRTLVREIVLDKETVEKVRMALISDDMETYLGAKEDYVVGTATFSGDGAHAVLSVQVRPLASDLNKQECGVFAQVEWYPGVNDTCTFCETQLEVGDNNIVREYMPSYGDKEGVKRKLIVKLKED